MCGKEGGGGNTPSSPYLLLREDEHGNVANDPRDTGMRPGESFLFCLTASALNRKSTSGDAPWNAHYAERGSEGRKSAHPPTVQELRRRRRAARAKVFVAAACSAAYGLWHPLGVS